MPASILRLGILIMLLPTVGFAAAINYSVIQGGSTSVDPMSHAGSTDVIDFYGYGTLGAPSGASSNTPIGLEQEGTAVFFLYDDTTYGISLGLILDAPGGATSNNATISFSGFPLGATRTVEDDNNDLVPLGGTSTTDSWWWNGSNTDGTVFSGLPGTWQIDVSFDFLDTIDNAVFVTGLNPDDTYTTMDIDLDDFSIVAAEAPEPGTMALLLLAGGATAMARRRRQS